MSEMESEASEKPKKAFRWVPSPKTIPEIYTNYVHPSWSLFDVRVLLGQLKPEVGNGDFIVEEVGAITFSWAHAKIIAEALTDMVSAYESVNGVIAKVNIAPNYEQIRQQKETSDESE